MPPCCPCRGIGDFVLSTAWLRTVGIRPDVARTRATGASRGAGSALSSGSTGLHVGAPCFRSTSAAGRRIAGRAVVGTSFALARLGESARSRQCKNADRRRYQLSHSNLLCESLLQALSQPAFSRSVPDHQGALVRPKGVSTGRNLRP
jgi:hypothetical protein